MKEIHVVCERMTRNGRKMVIFKVTTHLGDSDFRNRGLNKGGVGEAIAPPHFGRIEGASGQRRRAALLLAPPV